MTGEVSNSGAKMRTPILPMSLRDSNPTEPAGYRSVRLSTERQQRYPVVVVKRSPPPFAAGRQTTSLLLMASNAVYARKTEEVEFMDKDRVKGAANDAAGRVKRQVGEWTNNPNAQAEGAAQQVKGKVQKAWGNMKDAARNTSANVNRDQGSAADQERKSEAEREREHLHSGQHK